MELAISTSSRGDYDRQAGARTSLRRTPSAATSHLATPVHKAVELSSRDTL